MQKTAATGGRLFCGRPSGADCLLHGKEEQEMNENPLVSIIIPVYNGLPFLTEALDSAVRQTYRNLEILVIDDGSDDGSGEVCDDYAGRDSRIQVIHQENRGLSAARNVGLDRMTGDAAAFLDADDAFRPDAVERMLSVMMREKADIVICRFLRARTTGSLEKAASTAIRPVIDPGRYDRRDILQALVRDEVNFGIWNKLYAAGLWKDLRFPVGHVYEEIDTTFRVFDLCASVYVINDVLYLYRKHAGTITDTLNRANYSDWILARSHYEAYVEENIPALFTGEQLDAVRRARLGSMIRTYMLSRAGKGKRLDFEEELREMILDLRRSTKLEKCRFEVRMCCRLICFCPGLCRLLAPFAVRLGLLKSR